MIYGAFLTDEKEKNNEQSRRDFYQEYDGHYGKRGMGYRFARATQVGRRNARAHGEKVWDRQPLQFTRRTAHFDDSPYGVQILRGRTFVDLAEKGLRTQERECQRLDQMLKKRLEQTMDESEIDIAREHILIDIEKLSLLQTLNNNQIYITPPSNAKQKVN